MRRQVRTSPAQSRAPACEGVQEAGEIGDVENRWISGVVAVGIRVPRSEPVEEAGEVINVEDGRGARAVAAPEMLEPEPSGRRSAARRLFSTGTRLVRNPRLQRARLMAVPSRIHAGL